MCPISGKFISQNLVDLVYSKLSKSLRRCLDSTIQPLTSKIPGCALAIGQYINESSRSSSSKPVRRKAVSHASYKWPLGATPFCCALLYQSSHHQLLIKSLFYDTRLQLQLKRSRFYSSSKIIYLITIFTM